MKTRTIHTLAAITAALTATAMGQTSTWFYGASNNSSTFGVTANNSQAVTWMDSWAGSTNKDGTLFGTEGLQVNQESLAEDQSIMMFGFGGLGINSSSVGAATLYLRSDFSFPFGGPNTWNIVGIAAGNTNWDTANMTWNDLDTSSATDWTGGTILGSLTGSYGSFQDAGTETDTNIAINITGALKAYLNGTISGIAFVNSTNNGTYAGLNNAFVPYSNDNTIATNRPGLLVTTIPEPSSALLGLAGAMGLLLRRRR